MEKKEKGFNLKLYAVVAFFAVAVILALIVTVTFKSKYTAFHPEEVARNYVDTIVQTGDGYNAYKTTLVSKNDKYGNFIRRNYMYTVIYRDAGYKVGDSTDKLKGYNDKSYMGEKTKSDDGSLQGIVISKMYDYYVELVKNGWDDYDEFFTKYFEKLVEVRKFVFSDDYMTDEIMFTVLESNVKAYGESLTGTEEVIDKNTGNKTSEKQIGAYQKVYGEAYKLLCTTANEIDLDFEQYKSKLDTKKLDTYSVSADDITDAKSFNVEVKTYDGTEVASVEVIVVQIGSSWYVDNTNTTTASLYNFYKTK